MLIFLEYLSVSIVNANNKKLSFAYAKWRKQKKLALNGIMQKGIPLPLELLHRTHYIINIFVQAQGGAQ